MANRHAITSFQLLRKKERKKIFYLKKSYSLGGICGTTYTQPGDKLYSA